MYGYTPPAIIAVDPNLLSGCAGFQQVASALATQLRHRPVWCIVAAPEELVDAHPARRPWLMDAWYSDPRDCPDEVDDDLHAATADVLASHLRDEGFQLPVRHGPFAPQPHVPGSAIVPGTWKTAAQAAIALQAPYVQAWTEDEEWVAHTVQGVPFHFAPPGLSWAGRFDGATLF